MSELEQKQRLIPGEYYNAKPIRAYVTENKDANKSGLHVVFQCFDDSDKPIGTSSKTIWCTDATLEISTKELVLLGAAESDLYEDAFWAEPMKFMTQTEVRVQIEEQEYRGKKYIRVRWINAIVRQAGKEAGTRASDVFRKRAQMIADAASGTPVTVPETVTFYDDIPF